MKHTRIIAAFCGAGKTYICEKTDTKAVEVEYWKYKEKIGCEPRGMKDVAPIIPDQACLNFIKYLQIKSAKSRQPRNEIERLAATLPGIEP